MLKNLLISALLLSTPVLRSSNTPYFQHNINDNKPRQLFPTKIGPKTWRPMISIDIKRSLFNIWSINTYGTRLGYEFKGVHTFNIGLFAMANGGGLFPSYHMFHPSDKEYKETSYKSLHGSLYYERILFIHNKFRISLPTYLNYGKINEFNINANSHVREKKFNHNYIAVASGLQFHYYLLPWLCPKLSIGYRYSLRDEFNDKNFYDSFYIGLSAKIHWLPFFQLIKPKKR